MISLLAETAAAATDSSLLPAGLGVGGSVVIVLGLVKAIGAWLRDQLAAKDAIIAAKDVEIARVNADADKRLEALRLECAKERRDDRNELVAILKQAAGQHSGSGGVS